MLNAFDNQLRSLAETSYDQFRNEVKKRMNGILTEEQLSTLKEFIFLLPTTLKQLSLYWNKKDTPHDAKRVSGFLITYIYQPNDFLPENKHGLFGYLDDAYFVVEAFLQIQDRFLRDWHDKKSDELELISRAKRLIDAPRLIIPQETAQIDSMIKALIEGDNEKFKTFVANHS
jgi:uncharacterized membrane protein YkvA (DUF1232 family)